MIRGFELEKSSKIGKMKNEKNYSFYLKRKVVLWYFFLSEKKSLQLNFLSTNLDIERNFFKWVRKLWKKHRLGRGLFHISLAMVGILRFLTYIYLLCTTTLICWKISIFCLHAKYSFDIVLLSTWFFLWWGRRLFSIG